MQQLEIFKAIPVWLLVGIIGYIAFLVTIAVLRGQPVEFWPPKIGPRPTVPDGGNVSDSSLDLLIDGTWHLYFGFGTKRTKDSYVGFAQISNIKNGRFKMTINLNESKHGNKISNIFHYDGVVKNRQIVTTFQSENSVCGFMVGAMVMIPTPQCDKIFCGSTYVNRKNRITMDECLLMRT